MNSVERVMAAIRAEKPDRVRVRVQIFDLDTWEFKWPFVKDKDFTPTLKP